MAFSRGVLASTSSFEERTKGSSSARLRLRAWVFFLVSTDRQRGFFPCQTNNGCTKQTLHFMVSRVCLFCCFAQSGVGKQRPTCSVLTCLSLTHQNQVEKQVTLRRRQYGELKADKCSPVPMPVFMFCYSGCCCVFVVVLFLFLGLSNNYFLFVIILRISIVTRD